MNEIWNSWNLKAPPMCTIKTVLHHKEIRNLMDSVLEASTTLTTFKCLNSEAAILSRFLYKNKRRFRLDRAFQNLSKIYQCLKRYLKLDLKGTMQAYRSTLPKEVKQGASHAYLPTRQMLKWLLLRLMAFSQIFTRIISLAKEAGSHLYMKFQLGWQRNLCLIVYSMIARILVTSKFLVIKSIEWYNALFKYLPYLEETVKFVPNFIFPVDLKHWLGDADISPLKKKTPVDEVFAGINLVEDDNDIRIVSENLFKNFRVEIMGDSDIEDVPSKRTDEDLNKQIHKVSINSVEDLGVSIREEEEEEKKKKKKKKKNLRMKCKQKKKGMKAKNKKHKKVWQKPQKQTVEK